MKKFLGVAAVMAFALAMSAQSFAASKSVPAAPSGSQGGQAISPGGSDSCGLGWQVTDKKTLSATTTRETTNYTVPATFGMTTGTMGCEKHEFAKNEVPAVTYAVNNVENLSIEMAQGHGEFLQGFAVSMGCGENMTNALGQFTRAHYQEILQNDTGGVQMYENVRELIRQDPALSVVCQNVG